jgi:hypothetical protein
MMLASPLNEAAPYGQHRSSDLPLTWWGTI